MKRTTKGALAVTAAGVLLLGGAGSLAYWSDATDVDGGEIRSGRLSLGDATCDQGWVHSAGGPNAGAEVTSIVPGDKITKTCTFAITATGDNLAATLTTPPTATVTLSGTPAPTTLDLTVSSAYTIDGNATPSRITSANDGDMVTATLTVDFPFGDESTVNANDTQGLAGQLDAITVTLEQIES